MFFNAFPDNKERVVCMSKTTKNKIEDTIARIVNQKVANECYDKIWMQLRIKIWNLILSA